MRTEIIIVTFARDRQWVEYTLRSIQKFASGFACVKVIIPMDDLDAFLPLEKYRTADGAPVYIKRYIEFPGKGMIQHESVICEADLWCPGADMIMHVDSDCIFVQPFRPESYMVDGKPRLLYQTFESLQKSHPGHPVHNWKGATERAFNKPILYETMRRHPALHLRQIYGFTRHLIEQAHEMPAHDYIMQCQDVFPQGFCEFVSLGNAAMMEFSERYYLHDVEKEGYPDNALEQGWSRWGNEPEHKRKSALQRQAFEAFIAGNRKEGNRLLAAMNDRSHG